MTDTNDTNDTNEIPTPVDTPVDDPADDSNGHHWARFASLGMPARQRCSVCKVFRGKRAAFVACPGPLDDRIVDPRVDPRHAVLEGAAQLDDARLRDAVVNLLAGFDNRNGEGAAWEAGQVIAGHSKGDPAFYDKLVFVVEETGGVQLQHSNGNYEIIARGHSKISAKTLQRAVHEFHNGMRPSCPACGAKDYRQLFGIFRHRFEPTHCTSCKPT